MWVPRRIVFKKPCPDWPSKCPFTLNPKFQILNPKPLNPKLRISWDSVFWALTGLQPACSLQETPFPVFGLCILFSSEVMPKRGLRFILRVLRIVGDLV